MTPTPPQHAAALLHSTVSLRQFWSTHCANHRRGTRSALSAHTLRPYLLQVLLCILLLTPLTTVMSAQHLVLASNKPLSRLHGFDQLPHHLRITNDEASSHVQGIAVDLQRGFIYLSFTTKLIKVDFEGNVVGSVRGLSCHLGCLDLDTITGRLYASVEYKDDDIGQGISGGAAKGRANNFYIGIFDTEKINHPNINCETGNVMKTVYLPQVVADYQDSVTNQGVLVPHRYGCSGVDGISLGPQFGTTDGPRMLNIAYGVYSNTSRTDNDYQVLLQYSLDSLDKYAQPLVQATPHHSGPAKAQARYFVYTGNTSYGVQNLEYDASTHYWLMAVYKGNKSTFPNYALYAVDGTQAPTLETLRGMDSGEKGLVLPLAADGLQDATTGIRGWRQALGSTGLESIGNGYFVIATSGSDGTYQTATLQLYRWTGDTTSPFQLVN